MLNLEWDVILKDKNVDTQWRVFTEHLNKATNTFIPKKKIRTTKPSKKNGIHLNRKTLTKMRRKERLWKKYRDGKDERVFEQYKRVRNQVRKLSRNAVKKYEQDIAMAAKENPKRFWSYVKTKSKTKSSIANLYKDKENGVLTESDSEKANVLGDFFSSVFTEEPQDELPDIKVKDCPKENEIKITVEKVKKKLDELVINKSPGPDNLSPRILKELSSTLALPISIIFKNSINSGAIPNEWNYCKYNSNL